MAQVSPWSNVVTSMPLNGGPIFKGSDNNGADGGDADALKNAFVEKSIVFTLADSPIVLPIPLIFLDGSLAYTANVTAAMEDGTYLQSFAEKLKALGVVSLEERDQLPADSPPVKGAWTIQIFDSKQTSSSSSATKEVEVSGGHLSMRIPYLLISLGGMEDNTLATVPLLLSVLTLVLGRVNETIPIFANNSKQGGIAQSTAIGQFHHYHAALASLARVLYSEYSVSILSMDKVVGNSNSNKLSATPPVEATAAHPMEASDIDAWQPLLMAALFFADTCQPTSLATEGSAITIDGESPLHFAPFSKSAAEAFIQLFLQFHARFAQPIAVYLGDMATYVQSAQTMLLSTEEGDGSSPSIIKVTPEAASKYLELFPAKLLSGSSGDAMEGKQSSTSTRLPFRAIGLCGASYNILFLDDSVDSTLEAHCPSSLADEAEADSFLLKREVASTLFNGASPAVVAAVVKRFARHIVHGLRSDDFCDVELAETTGAYENTAATLDADAFGIPMDTLYDNKTGSLRVGLITAGASAFLRAVLWEGLVAQYQSTVLAPSAIAAAGASATTGSTSALAVDLNAFISGQQQPQPSLRTSSIGKGAAGSGMAAVFSSFSGGSAAAPPGANNSPSRSFRQICQSFTSNLRHRTDCWAIEGFLTSDSENVVVNQQQQHQAAMGKAARSATSYSAGGTHVIGGSGSNHNQSPSLGASTNVEPIEAAFNRSLSGPPAAIPIPLTNLSPASTTVSVGHVVLVPPTATSSGDYSSNQKVTATNSPASAPVGVGAFGAPKVAVHDHLYNFNHTSFTSLVGGSVNQFALLVNAEEVLYSLCKNAADVVARLGGTSATSEGSSADPKAPLYTLTPKFAIPSSVLSVLLALYECAPISPTFMVSFPSPSLSGYSPAVAPVAPRAVAGLPVNGSQAGKNAHEVLFESVLLRRASTESIDGQTYLWKAAAVAGEEEQEDSPTVVINSYADVCAAHHTLSLLIGTGSEANHTLPTNYKSLFTKVCVPFSTTAQAALLICGTSQELPHPLTEASVASQTEDYAAFLLHNLSLHSHVQEGAKNLFLEKCLRSSLAFAKAPNAPRPDLLPPVINAALKIEHGSDEPEEAFTTLLTSFENPLGKSRRVRLIHLAFARQLLLPVVGSLAFSEDADALRAGVRGYSLADEDEAAQYDIPGAGGSSTSIPSASGAHSDPSNTGAAHPLAFLWKPTVKVLPTSDSSTPIAQQGFMHSQVHNGTHTTNTGAPSGSTPNLNSPTNTLKAVVGDLGFGDLFPIVRNYNGPLDVPEPHTTVAAAARHYASPLSSPSTQSPRAITAVTSLVLSSATSEAGGPESAASMPASLSVAPFVSLNNSQQREACSCLTQGSLGSVAAVYALCNSLKVPTAPIVTPTAATKSLIVSASTPSGSTSVVMADSLSVEANPLVQQQQIGEFGANFDILFTDVRESLLPVALVGPAGGARRSYSPRRSGMSPRPSTALSYDNTAAAASLPHGSKAPTTTSSADEKVFTVCYNNNACADAHLARRLLLKLSYVLNHPSMVSYLLTAPETHADRFRELFNLNFFDLADEKKLVSGGSEPSEVKNKTTGGDDANEEVADDGSNNYNSMQNNFTKKYKTRIEMLYEAVLAPVILYERRVAASGAASATRYTTATKEGGFALSPWLVLWYKFFLSLSVNAERRMVASNNNNSEAILLAAAGDVNAHKSAAPAHTATSASQQTTVGVPQDILHAIVETVEELQTLCPALALTTTEGLLAQQQQQQQQLNASTNTGSVLGGNNSATGAASSGVISDSTLPSVIGPSSSTSAPMATPQAAAPTLEDRFAAAQKAFGKVADKHPNDTKLLFYSLFKQATVGDVNIGRPWAVDMTGRAKWDAWAKHKGMDKKVAMSQYCDSWDKIAAAGAKRF